MCVFVLHGSYIFTCMSDGEQEYAKEKIKIGMWGRNAKN